MEALSNDTSAVVSQTELEVDRNEESQPVLRLRLQKPKNDRKVEWREDTVDNEHMGKKKSKCCCIYKKPVAFGESSSEDDEECEHCFGHPEKRRKNRKKHGDHDHEHNEHGHDHDHDEHDGSGHKVNHSQVQECDINDPYCELRTPQPAEPPPQPEESRADA